MKKLNIVTLGCSKNLVDSEHLMAQFKASGFRVVHDDFEQPSDTVVINTCGFILDAREESIDTIISFLEEKRRGNLRKLFVIGCLTERYRKELQQELPEVDGFFGVNEMPRILEATGSRLEERLLTERIITTPSHYAYLKISEGCNRACSFCAIPGIRGPQRSISVERLMEESSMLAGRGVQELILIAQDLTSYGTDLYRRKALPNLLKELLKVPGFEWIRLHYAYPSGFPEEIMELMAGEKRICNYLDIPIQHINDRILSAMNRGHDRRTLEKLLQRFRTMIPDVAIRTTVLTGFPGETEAEFNELLGFLKDFRFDRLGVFPYSHEEHAPASEHFTDDIPARVKSERADAIMELQREISLEMNNEKVGKRYTVLIDRIEGGYSIGRTQYDSPDVDQEVFIPEGEGLKVGVFYQVEITGAEEFDLYGIRA